MSALFALVLACSPAMTDWASAGAEEDASGKKARKKTPREGKAKPPKPKGPRGEYAIMASVLEMDDAQKAKLMEAVEASGKAIRDWDNGDSGKKYKELNDARKQAAKDKDKEKIKSIGEQLKPLQKERADLMAAQKTAIMNVLTPEQKAKWAGFELYRNVMRRYKAAKLTEDQDKQLRDLCAAQAPKLPDSSDRKAYGGAMKQLYAEIDEKILTGTQREELKKKPEKQPKEPKAKKERQPRAKKGGDSPAIVE
jgi:Spy/CpxP family protein refolding chaperone